MVESQKEVTRTRMTKDTLNHKKVTTNQATTKVVTVISLATARARGRRTTTTGSRDPQLAPATRVTNLKLDPATRVTNLDITMTSPPTTKASDLNRTTQLKNMLLSRIQKSTKKDPTKKLPLNKPGLQ
jgi:hypothetical protein